MIRKILAICTLLLLAACGNIATPVYDAPTATPTLVPTTGSEQVAAQPTATTIPPTDVPTAAPTEVPTQVPTEAPTAAPTEAPDTVKVFVDLASASNGSRLFHEVEYDTDQGVWKCETCHNTEGDEIKIGPSQFGLINRAGTRIPGTGPYTYIYNSIRESQAFIVPGFEDAAKMPHFTKEILKDSEVYDIIAYLVTLK